MSKLVTIFGGSGFVGRYFARRMAKQGWRVRVAVRNPNEAMFVKPYGVVGQVEPVLCNIRDDASVEAALQGASAAVNCVGILMPKGKNTFDAVQEQAPGRIGRLAAKNGVGKVVHVSAIGADVNSESTYSRTKALGEEALLAAFPSAVILRPSVIFGNEDQFFNRFAQMAQLSPILPLVGAETRFQPIYVDDVAQAVEQAVLTDVEAGVYELGGPDVMTFRQLMRLMLGVIRRRRLLANIPFGVAGIMASVSELAAKMTLGLVPPVITRDQVADLKSDNVVSDDARGLNAFGIEATDIESVLPDYLWRFRPSGQYAAIKESAKNLREI